MDNYISFGLSSQVRFTTGVMGTRKWMQHDVNKCILTHGKRLIQSSNQCVVAQLEFVVRP